MRGGWTVQLIAASGGVRLEFLGPSADDWYGDGAVGCALGSLGLDDDWAIATDPIGPSRVRLIEWGLTSAGVE